MAAQKPNKAELESFQSDSMGVGLLKTCPLGDGSTESKETSRS